MDEADTDADSSESTGSPDTVQVRLGVRLRVTWTFHGDVIVDDHGDAGNVDTTGENIGGDQDLGLSGPEVVQESIAVLPLVGSVKCRHPVSVGFHAALNLVSTLTRL